MTRQYETSHPWLTFRLDLGRVPWTTWMLLGEAQSKLDHLSGVPLRPSTADELHRLYLAKGVLATTAIEGNTLSEEEVRKHIDGKLELPPSKEYLKKEIANILDACHWVWRQGPGAVTVDFIKECNSRVLNGLSVKEEVIPGRIRMYYVGVARYRGAPPADCEYLLARLCDWLEQLTHHSPSHARMAIAIVKAVMAHLYLAWIHPFGDGNGRTARLVEFKILVSAGVPTPAAHLLSNHYNETRAEYYRQLDYASSSGGDVIQFLNYAVQGLVDGLRAQLALIRDQQLDVVWRNYVHELFKGDASPSAVRQRQLILDLSLHGEPMLKSDLPNVSTRMAKEYAHKTSKTLSRDVNELLAMGLLVREGTRYRAQKELILAFLPERYEGDAPPPVIVEDERDVEDNLPDVEPTPGVTHSEPPSVSHGGK